MPEIEQQIKRKIEATGTPLKQWDVHIYRGILTGLNEAFIIDSATKDALVAADPKSAEIIRPILRGRDIKRYRYEFANLFIIATFPSRHYNIDDYPAVKDYLLSIGINRLEQTGVTHIVNGVEVKARKKTNNKWFETQDSIGYWDDFSKQKIAWGNLCLSAQYAWVTDTFFVNNPANIIVPGDKYLLGVLNSKVADFYIRNLGVTRNGGYFEYKPMFVEKLPVPQISDTDKVLVIQLVDRILEMQKLGEDSTKLEAELNAILYAVYELNEAEIMFLESKGYPE